MDHNSKNYGLPVSTIKTINTVFKSHENIEEVILYGSRAKGNFKPGSDIDLTLIGKNIDYSILLKILTQLDDLLLPYKIDLSIYRQIENQDLIDHINRVGKIFYKRIT